ncbi:MAG: hypothetical protein JKY02_07915 [Flavobacteriaceae bacterium]|nr:hypothetical protein [Flavobacteriaceae bacterium]
MKKSILNIGKTLNKVQQKQVQGGAPGGAVCSTVCINAGYGVRCDLHAGCPGALDGMCDGNGGYYLL